MLCQRTEGRSITPCLEETCHVGIKTTVTSGNREQKCVEEGWGNKEKPSECRYKRALIFLENSCFSFCFLKET